MCRILLNVIPLKYSGYFSVFGGQDAETHEYLKITRHVEFQVSEGRHGDQGERLDRAPQAGSLYVKEFKGSARRAGEVHGK